jgi:hypothetical protein
MVFNTLLISNSTLSNWANEFVVGAATVLTNRQIYMYSVTTHSQQMNFIYNLDLQNDDNLPLSIALHINHFVPLIPKSIDSTLPRPQNRYFANI